MENCKSTFSDFEELLTKEADVPEVETSYQYVLKFRETTLKVAQKELAKNYQKNKRLHDRKAKKRVFKEGNKVAYWFYCQKIITNC